MNQLSYFCSLVNNTFCYCFVAALTPSKMSPCGLLRLPFVFKCFSSKWKKNWFVPNQYSQYKNIQANANVERQVSNTPLKKSTEKDTLLFYNEQPTFYRVLNICAIIQFFFWVQMGQFTYSKMKEVDIPENENLPWWRRINFKDNRARIAVSATCYWLGRYCNIIYGTCLTLGVFFIDLDVRGFFLFIRQCYTVCCG